MTEFEVFANDHQKHAHCMACNCCLLDPRPFVQNTRQLWCIACRDQIAQNAKPGVPLPWEGGWSIEDGNLVLVPAKAPECPYCTSDNEAIRTTYYDQTCEGCVKRMGRG